MGDVTPIYEFPYPIGTDRVMDGDNAMQALAEAVEGAIGNPRAGCLSATAVASGGGAWTLHAAGFAADPLFPVSGDIAVTSAGITVNSAGIYFVMAQVTWGQGTTSGTAARRGVAIGDAVGAFASVQTMDNSALHLSTSQMVAGVALCAAGSALRVYRYLDAAGNATGTNSAALRAVRLAGI